MGWGPRTLKGQLTALFLILSLVPVLLLTALATHRLWSALERWSSPEVQRALTGSMDMTRDLLERTENDLRQRGQLLAADPVWGPEPRPGTTGSVFPDTNRVRERLANAYNLDFVQGYSPEGRLLFEATRDPTIAPPGAMPGIDSVAAGERPFLENRAENLLAYAGAAGTPGEREWILVAGIYLEAGFYERLADLGGAVAYYSTLPLLIRVNQRVALGTLAGIVVLLAAGSVGIARTLAARVSRPVEGLGRGMERVAGGDEGVRVPPQGTEEMERLIATFNAMSAELSLSRRELARAERLAAWREAAQRVAHEMKNALTPILFSVHRLKARSDPGEAVRLDRPASDPERDRFDRALETVIEEIEGLRRLAASFGELARLPIPEMAPLDLRELARGVVAAHASEPRRFALSVADGPVMVEGDRSLLRQAFTNIVKNAVEATAEGDTIWVALEPAGDGVRFTVEDEGPGYTLWVALAPAGDGVRFTVEDEGPGWGDGMREKALEPYVTTKAEGTGLGLSLVQRTVFQHGGSVELEDRPGGGARVRVLLPARPSARTA